MECRKLGQQAYQWLFNINSLIMQSAKSDIKSKKAKLSEKQHRKQKLTVKPIEISSSESDPHPVPVQTRRSPSRQPPQDHPRRYNVFNIDRLKKIEIEPTPPQGRELAVEENTRENPMHHTDARALFTYRIEGNESTKYVSDLYLEQRIKKIAEEDQARALSREKSQAAEAELQLEEQKEGEEPEAAEKEEEEGGEKKGRPVRYFESLTKDGEEERDMVKCFRCGKRGHIAKNCLEEREQVKCLYCLGDHHHHDCNARACFKCNELGHIAQECRSMAIECRKCRKKGHAEKQCGIIVFLDYSRIRSDQEFREKYSGDDLRKIRCLAGCKDPNGHFNCHEYKQLATKHAPYATYHRSDDALPAFKGLAKYQHSDFEPRHQKNSERSYEGGYGRGYERYERFERYERHERREQRGSSKGKHKSQPASYDSYNQKYNIGYGYNANQRINQRYDYSGHRW